MQIQVSMSLMNMSQLVQSTHTHTHKTDWGVDVTVVMDDCCYVGVWGYKIVTMGGRGFTMGVCGRECQNWHTSISNQ